MVRRSVLSGLSSASCEAAAARICSAAKIMQISRAPLTNPYPAFFRFFITFDRLRLPYFSRHLHRFL